MEIYYLQDNWLEGPVDADRLKVMIDEGAITQDNPAWTPTFETWTPCSNLLEPSDDETLVSFDDTSFMHTRDLVVQLERMDLPPPRDMLALRIAKEQELITSDQAERCLAEMMEATSEAIDLPRRLHARGWITASQRSHLQTVLDKDSVPKLIAGYEILEELGRGGMGTTYRAKQISMDRDVALKVLLPKLGQDRDYVRRFEREARMAARLNHENIATAYEVGSVAGQHYFSMEYVEGKTVAQMLKEDGRFDEEKAGNITVQVCRALQHAHEHEMIHRDISPKNIIVKADGKVKLIDMGLTKSTDPQASEFTTVGMTVGTPAYISPEQALGKDNVDIRSDIYSLGCVLFEMISGTPPLMGGSAVETLTMHIHTPVPPLKSKCHTASDLICHVVQKMTAMDPDDRFQLPQDVIDGFAADDKTVRMALHAAETIVPVKKQLAQWVDDEPITITLPVSGRENTHRIAQKLEEKLLAAKADAEFQGYVQTLFAELVANAFDHGCKGLTDGVVRITLELNDAFFRIEVEDPGPGFEAEKMLQKIKNEPVDRERRRGIMQVMNLADSLTYPSGNHAKAVLYRKSEGSGIVTRESDDIVYIEIKGKGDLALSEEFRRWVDKYSPRKPEKLCLLVRTDWVSSMFVGTIGKLNSKVKNFGCALSVWVEHRSCLKIMEQLGIRSFVRIYDSPETAKMALRYAKIGRPDEENGEEDSGRDDEHESDRNVSRDSESGAGNKRSSTKKRSGSKRASVRKPPVDKEPDRGILGNLWVKLFGE